MHEAGSSAPLRVTLRDGTVQQVPWNTKIVDITRHLPREDPAYPILAARVDNKLHSLSYQLRKDCRLDLHTYRDPEGVEVYRRTLCMILSRAVTELRTNTRLVIAHSMGNGYYYDYYTDISVSEPLLETITDKMREIVEKDEPIERRVLSMPEAIEFFQKLGHTDKARLLKHTEATKLAVYSCGTFTDLGHGPIAPSTGYTRVFQLKPYHNGFILIFPEPGDMQIHYQLKSHRKVFNVYHERRSGGKTPRGQQRGPLQRDSDLGRAPELIRVAEALQEKKIAQLADTIAAKPEGKLILIAGPSSSGKTTTAKRLAVQLQASGLRPVALGLDDYFVNRDDTPLDEDGNLDYEVLEALDVTLFNEHLPRLLAGQEVEIPRFNFSVGRRDGFKPRFGWTTTRCSSWRASTA